MSLSARRPGFAGGALTIVIATIVMLGLGASPVAADPAGPTNYRTTIDAVEPATDRIDLAIIGGDSFVQLTAAAGTQVLVVGYQGEPYLRFEADGVVLQNERSPSRWLNDDRFGGADIPAAADPDAEPEWVEVATEGRFAWHDHRAHWMNPVDPPGAAAGDVILEAVIPLEVDGAEVKVSVSSTLLAAPSPLRWVLLGALCLVAVGVAWLRLGLSALARIGAVAAAGATSLGLWAFVSVPSETAPSLLLWVLPLIGFLAFVGAVVTDRGRKSGVWPGGLALIGGVELALWGWTRRSGLTRALVPTDAPISIDRATVAVAMAGGAAVAVASAITLATGRPGPARSDTTTSP